MAAVMQKHFGEHHPSVLLCLCGLVLLLALHPRVTALTVVAGGEGASICTLAPCYHARLPSCPDQYPNPHDMTGMAAHTSAAAPFTTMTEPVVAWFSSVALSGTKQFSLDLLLIIFVWRPRLVAMSSFATVLVFKGFVPQSWIITFKQKAEQLGEATKLSALVGGVAALIGFITFFRFQPDFILTIVASVLSTFCLLGGGWGRWAEILEFKSEQGAGTGKLTITLIWKTSDDLDLWCEPPNAPKIYYSNKRSGGGYLDVDANAGSSIMEVNGSIKAVENIFFEDTPASGTYKVTVNNYSHRTGAPVPFDVGIQINGKMAHLYSGTATRGSEELHVCNISIDENSRATVAMGTGVRKG